VDKTMALNGTEWRNAPWNTTFSPYTDLFANIFGNGNIFYVLPIIVLSFGIYMKTESPVFAAMFLMAASGILTLGSFMGGLTELSMMFTIFTAIGFTIVVTSIIFQKKGG